MPKKSVVRYRPYPEPETSARASRCRGLSAGAYLWRGAQPTATLSGVEYFSSARQAELAWGRDPGVVQDLCRRKEVPGAFKGEDGRYKIPKGPEPPGPPRRDKLTEEEGREIARLAHAGARRGEQDPTGGKAWHRAQPRPLADAQVPGRRGRRGGARPGEAFAHGRGGRDEGRTAVRRAVREAKGNLEAERERLSRELSEVEDELRALEAADTLLR